MNFDEALPRRKFGSIKWNRYPEDVIPLWVADMDFPAAPCIQQAIQKVHSHGIYGYTLPQRGLIGAVINYLKEQHEWEVKASSIVWLPGLVSALNIACRAYTQPGRGVMTSTPIYPPFLDAPEFSGRGLKTIPLLFKNEQYTMDFETIREQVRSKTSLYLLCNPHNPVGRCFTKEELQELADICLENNTIICSDEIHCDLVLDKNAKHIPIATLSPEIEQRTITLMAPSKTYNLPGLGFAFAIIPNYKLRKKFLRIMKGIVPYPTQIGLHAAEAAYKEGGSWRQELITHLVDNKKFLQEYISEKMPQISYTPGEATYLAWIDVSKLKLDNPAAYFVKAGVGLSDGAEFQGEGFLRLNFACSRPLLEEGLERMRQAIDSL